MDITRSEVINRNNGRHAWNEGFDAPSALDTGRGYPLNARRVHFAAKEVIYRAGEPADKLYEIQGGLIKLLNYLSNGKERIIRLHGSNDWIGLANLQQTYEHTAIAVSPVEAYCIPASDFLHWKTGNPLQYHGLLENLFQHLKKADIWIEQFSTGCIKARVARLINFLSEVEYGQGSTRVRLLTCEEMAAILGSTTESVSTALAEFKRNGILRPLKSKAQKLYECNPAALSHHLCG
jgi:CRP/FNR family transcriptional regulator